MLLLYPIDLCQQSGRGTGKQSQRMSPWLRVGPACAVSVPGAAPGWLQGCSTALTAARCSSAAAAAGSRADCRLSHSVKQYNLTSDFLLHSCPRSSQLQWFPPVLSVKCSLQLPWLSDYMSSRISVSSRF